MTSRSQLYPLARQLFATGALNWPASNIKIALLPATFTPDFTAQYLSDLQAATTIMATSGNITGLTAAGGYCGGNSTSLGIISSPLVAGALYSPGHGFSLSLAAAAVALGAAGAMSVLAL